MHELEDSKSDSATEVAVPINGSCPDCQEHQGTPSCSRAKQ